MRLTKSLVIGGSALALAVGYAFADKAANDPGNVLSLEPCHLGDRCHARVGTLRAASVQRYAHENPPIAGGHFLAPDGPL